ncbi:MAG: sigma-54-dependent Fis family transcriptional regulator [Firmicutes bacterium]|nr:sigma-54-dependent Fis family transcriptional regulator [Bacillota bacterium]
MKNIIGSRRVDGSQTLPVHAWKLDNSKEINPDELRLRVVKIHLENGSFNQICMETYGEDAKVRERVMQLVSQRGKLHNPYTGTGGLIAGVVDEIGPLFSNENNLKVGDEIFIPISASILPLYLEKIHKVDYAYGHLDVDGHAILYNHCPTIRKHPDIPWDLLLVAFEESASIHNVSKLAAGKERVLIIGSNPMVAMLYSLAVSGSMKEGGDLVGVLYGDKILEMSEGEEQKRNKFFYSIFDEVYSMNRATAIECVDYVTMNGSRYFDVIVNCADQMGAEAVSVMAAKEGASLFFSNLSNNYTLALYIQEAINRDMYMQCATGYSSGYYDFMMDFLSRNMERIVDLGNLLTKIYQAKRERSKINPPERSDQLQSIHELLHCKSPKMLELASEIEKVARFNCSVIIEGESGSGKEVLAGMLQKMSDRNATPYVKVNCAAIPKELMESEFFGYEKGAFTGASGEGKKGFFEMANGGILFLDEVTEIPYEIQAKLLRAIQEGEFYKVGAQKTTTVDVRIIAATNQNLLRAVQEGSFREDLYYRLAVVRLRVPSLRERLEDVIPLAEYFLEKYSKQYGFEKTLSEEAKQLLLDYNWPGNVRELENTIQRLLISSRENVITAGDVLLEYSKISEIEKTSATAGLDINGDSSFAYRVETFERSLLQQALEKYGSTYKAAEALQMTQSQFARKKKKYEL